jgi:hypothetical protein
MQWLKLVPPFIFRAATFYIDRQWGSIITALMNLYGPTTNSLAMLILIVVIMSLFLRLCERIFTGDVSIFNFSQQEDVQTTDPNIGILPGYASAPVSF